MKKLLYFAIFEPTDTGYSVYFPDLLGCITVGKDLDESIKMAKEVLGLHLWGLEKDGEIIPEPSKPPYSDMDEDCFAVPIEVFPDIVKNDIEGKSVKKTLTLPYWLNELAEHESVNFSEILQNALKEYLNIATS